MGIISIRYLNICYLEGEMYETMVKAVLGIEVTVTHINQGSVWSFLWLGIYIYIYVKFCIQTQLQSGLILSCSITVSVVFV